MFRARRLRWLPGASVMEGVTLLLCAKMAKICYMMLLRYTCWRVRYCPSVQTCRPFRAAATPTSAGAICFSAAFDIALRYTPLFFRFSLRLILHRALVDRYLRSSMSLMIFTPRRHHGHFRRLLRYRFLFAVTPFRFYLLITPSCRHSSTLPFLHAFSPYIDTLLIGHA